MTETKLVSRSSGLGIAITVAKNSAPDRNALTQVPTARKIPPCEVNGTTRMTPLESENETSCGMIASHNRT